MNAPLVAVIVAEPAATAAIVPSFVTVATDSLLDENVVAETTVPASDALVGSAETVTCLVAPTLIVAVF
ncbi:hypothetical protein LGMK_06900 [Leuconostoc sp. C2]|nr:hypothetical protein LGMK_06900 [Leuconostoc sp. C2]